MLRGGPWDKMPRMLQLFDCPALGGASRPKRRILNTRFKTDGQVSATGVRGGDGAVGDLMRKSRRFAGIQHIFTVGLRRHTSLRS